MVNNHIIISIIYHHGFFPAQFGFRVPLGRHKLTYFALLCYKEAQLTGSKLVATFLGLKFSAACSRCCERKTFIRKMLLCYYQKQALNPVPLELNLYHWTTPVPLKNHGSIFLKYL